MPHSTDDAHYLAFDLGAESGRAVLGTLDGHRLSVHEVRRFPNTPLPLAGHIHWNVYALFEEMKEAMRDAAAAIGRRPTSLGVDTWGVDFGLLAKDGSLLGLPFCYRDHRNAGAMEDYFKLVPRPALYEATGIQFMPFNTLFQVYAMVRERSPLLDAAADLLFMPDLFNFFLTGRKAAEFTIASTSQFLDPRTKTWIPGLFQAMGFSRKLLQDIVEPGTVLGEIAEEIAAATGFRHVPVVATASHDTAAAVAAVPAEGRNWAYISSGTWSLVGVEEKPPVISEGSLDSNFTNEGGVGGTVRFLKNVSGLWLVQGCRRSWSAEGPVTYDDLTRAAAEAPAFAALIDPDDPGFLNPPDMPEAIADYCRRTGQKPPATRGALVRALFESLALKYRPGHRSAAPCPRPSHRKDPCYRRRLAELASLPAHGGRDGTARRGRPGRSDRHRKYSRPGHGHRPRLFAGRDPGHHPRFVRASDLCAFGILRGLGSGRDPLPGHPSGLTAQGRRHI